MLVALTGATGFLGRYLVDELVLAGHTLRCLHRPSSNRTGFSDEVADRIEWVAGDLADVQSFNSLVGGADAVVHSALYRPEGRSFRDAAYLDQLIDTNLCGSLHLMKESHEAKVGRFVLISTCAVHEVILQDRPLDECHPLWPTSHYGAHKAALEAFVASFGLGEGWPICALRPCGIYGVARPASDSKYYNLVKDVLAHRPVQSARGGKEVHARDVARATQLLLRTDGDRIAGQAFNCCDRYISDEQVARIVKELSGSTSEVSSLNRGPKNQINTDKLRSLGFEFGGEDRLRETIGQLIKAQN